MRVTFPYTIFPRTLSSGKTVYYYQFRYPSGKRSTSKSTGCTKLSAAKRFCQTLYNAGEFEQQTDIKFSAFSKDFFSKDGDYYKWKLVNRQEVTDNTLMRYVQLLNYQILPYFSDIRLDKITRSIVKDWVIWASSQWSAKTVNNAQTVLNIILKTAVEKELLKYNPAANIGFRKTEKLDRNTFTIDELKLIYNSKSWTHSYLKRAFLLCAITGMRINEITCLTSNDIFEDYIYVARTYHPQLGLGKTTKGKTSRIVPIPKNFEFPKGNSDFIFSDKTGKPFNSCRMRDNIKSICIENHIDYENRHLSTHSLRAFYNSYLEYQNISDAKIKAVIGHKDSSMTGLYTYWKPNMFDEVHIAQDKLYKEIIYG